MLRGNSPHHVSFEKFTLLQSLRAQRVLLLKMSHSLLIAFHTSNPNHPLLRKITILHFYAKLFNNYFIL